MQMVTIERNAYIPEMSEALVVLYASDPNPIEVRLAIQYGI